MAGKDGSVGADDGAVGADDGAVICGTDIQDFCAAASLCRQKAANALIYSPAD